MPKKKKKVRKPYVPKKAVPVQPSKAEPASEGQDSKTVVRWIAQIIRWSREPEAFIWSAFIPVIVAPFVVRGSFIVSFQPFFTFLLLLLSTTYFAFSAASLERPNLLHSRKLLLLLLLTLAAGALVVLQSYSGLTLALVLGMIFAQTIVFVGKPQSIKGLLGVVCCLLVFMGAATLLAGYLQVAPTVPWFVAAFGLSPACIGGGALLVGGVSLFDEKGWWNRSRPHTRKSGKVIQRPGPLSLLLSAFLLFLPSISVYLAVMQFLPLAFLFVLFILPRCCALMSDFHERNLPDEEIYLRLNQMFVAHNFILILIALLAREF